MLISPDGARDGDNLLAAADAEDSAADVERARAAARELDALSTELNRLLGVFTV